SLLAIQQLSLGPLPHLFSSLTRRLPRSTLFPYTTLFRSVSKGELSEEYITPSMFDGRVVPAVAAAVAEAASRTGVARRRRRATRSEEHTSELQSRFDLVCRLLLEKKKKRSPYLTPPSL